MIGNILIVVQISLLPIISSGFYNSKDPGLNFLNIAITSVKSLCTSISKVIYKGQTSNIITLYVVLSNIFHRKFSSMSNILKPQSIKKLIDKYSLSWFILKPWPCQICCKISLHINYAINFRRSLTLQVFVLDKRYM